MHVVPFGSKAVDGASGGFHFAPLQGEVGKVHNGFLTNGQPLFFQLLVQRQQLLRHPVIHVDETILIAKGIEAFYYFLEGSFVCIYGAFQYKRKMACYFKRDESLPVPGKEIKLVGIGFEIVQCGMAVLLYQL